MDFCTSSIDLHLWLHHYGSLALFVLLAIGIIAVPIPVEVLLLTVGALASKGDLAITQTMVSAYAGSACGITAGYLMGRSIGHSLLMKYGKWVGLQEKHWEKAHAWFERFGKWALLFCCFVPGLRHLASLLAGTTALRFKEFALFAYIGTFIWASTYLGIGYFFGHHDWAMCRDK